MSVGGVLSSATAVAGTRGEYPSMVGLLPPKLDIYQGVLPGYFSNPNCQLTVGIMLHDGEAVYLIHPAKAPGTSRALVFPQEKVKCVTDGALRNAVLRGLQEELGLSSKDVKLHPEELFRFENHIPTDRTGGVLKTKCIVYFAAKVSTMVRFCPNPREVREVVSTTGDQYLDQGLASRRTHKCAAQTEAIVSALTAGLLNKKSWSVFKHLVPPQNTAVQ